MSLSWEDVSYIIKFTDEKLRDEWHQKLVEFHTIAKSSQGLQKKSPRAKEEVPERRKGNGSHIKKRKKSREMKRDFVPLPPDDEVVTVNPLLKFLKSKKNRAILRAMGLTRFVALNTARRSLNASSNTLEIPLSGRRERRSTSTVLSKCLESATINQTSEAPLGPHHSLPPAPPKKVHQLTQEKRMYMNRFSSFGSLQNKKISKSVNTGKFRPPRAGPRTVLTSPLQYPLRTLSPSFYNESLVPG